MYEPVPGKGEAMRAGVAAVDRADVIVFLDADLVGLRPKHVDRLVRDVTGRGADMACGLFDRGPLANPIFLRHLPVLTGQRAVRRELFELLDDADVRGYRGRGRAQQPRLPPGPGAARPSATIGKVGHLKSPFVGDWSAR